MGLYELKPQHNVLCSLSIFAENRLALSNLVATLFPVLMSLPQHTESLALPLLCHFVGAVLAAQFSRVQQVLEH